jgi:DNA-binding NtrC family response regulator
MARILLVDDEPHLRHILAAVLSERGHHVQSAASGEEALTAIAQPPHPDVAVLDLTLPGATGLETFRALKLQVPALAGIFMTAYGSIRSAVDAIRAGGDDYLTKPFDNEELLLAIDRVLEMRRLAMEVQELRRELNDRYGFDEIIGISPQMREVFRIMSRVATTDATVLILGESGTGKELVARAIHRRCRRSAGPFVPVNCSAIPSALLESEFFGFERGAFTDAREAHQGKFEQADGGTLFLDEVGDLPVDAQAKLLRVLQDLTVTRLGGRRPIKVDVRIIAATNKDLEASVRAGRFREDLYWRLNVLSIKLPPLRDRADDLPLLIDALVQRLNQQLNLDVHSISAQARALLLAHDWPGNIRELENTLQRSLVLCEGHCLEARDLPPRLRGERTADQAPGESAEALTLTDAVRQATERVERVWIKAALVESGWSRTSTADRLGINRKTLFNKMKLYGLLAEDEPEPE